MVAEGGEAEGAAEGAVVDALLADGITPSALVESARNATGAPPRPAAREASATTEAEAEGAARAMLLARVKAILDPVAVFMLIAGL